MNYPWLSEIVTPIVAGMKIAVIGSGISGLGAAYILSRKYEVHLYEASSRLGGHAHTTTIKEQEGNIPVDVGFLVYNTLTYPHLTALFDHLGVETVESNMGLSIRLQHEDMEWAGDNLNTVFAQRKNLVNLKFLKFLREILRFHKEAEELLIQSRRHGWLLGELLKERKYSEVFLTHYLLPMGAAIWSTSESKMLDFPASTFMTFMLNHKLVQVNHRPVWRTVKGGSIEYVKKIASHLDHVYTSSPVTQVRSIENGARLRTPQGEKTYEKVVFATHAPVTRRILEAPEKRVDEVLSSFQVSRNIGVLHQDSRFMPKRQRCWSAWNVIGSEPTKGDSVSLSYFLNKLQPLEALENYFLTLNPRDEVDAGIETFEFDHPLMTAKAIRAQLDIDSIQGRGNIYYAGAWTRYGFHEDGLLSAVRVAQKMNVDPPWTLAQS